MRYRMIFLTLLVLPCLVDAGTMYHWKDEFGQAHFTDNIGLVPEKHRVEPERKLPDFESPYGATSAGGGKEIWQNKCQSCHYVGIEVSPAGLVSLSKLLIDNSRNDGGNNLNHRQMVELAVSHVLSNSHSSLVRPKLSQSEIKVLSYELLQMQGNAIENNDH